MLEIDRITIVIDSDNAITTYYYSNDYPDMSTFEAATAVENSNPTLAYGTTSIIGSVGGTELTVTMPAAPVTSIKGNAESTYRTGQVNLTPANLGISATSTSVTVGGTTFNKYTHPTTSGNKHIPSGGSSGQFLGWDSDGTAKWVNNPNTNDNYYHKTGSWSGLTYTAGKVGSPDDLAFTIPTGTTATTVAVGNHVHGSITNDGALGTASRIVVTDANKKITVGSIDPANLVVTSDSRLSDARTPKSHTHGNLTNDGKVGTTADYAIVTTTGGAITAISLAVTSPTAATTTSTTFIDTVSQASNGKISATKKTLPSATTSVAGIVQLSSATNSTSTSLAATASAVKSAYDLANGAIPKSVGTAAGDIIYFSAASTPTRLAKGTEGQVLKINSSGVPAWSTDNNYITIRTWS